MFLATCGLNDFEEFVRVWRTETKLAAVETLPKSLKLGTDTILD